MDKRALAMVTLRRALFILSCTVVACNTSPTPTLDIVSALDTAAQDTGNGPDTTVPADTVPAADTTPIVDTTFPDTYEPPLSDTEAPKWPVGASLKASGITPENLTLTWPHAVDGTLVTGYWVYQHAKQIAHLSPAVTSLEVENLKEALAYGFAVFSEDAAGNRSLPLTLTVSTGDMTPPSWPDGATIELSSITDTSGHVAFTPAQDNVAVTEYRLMSGDTLLHTVVGSPEAVLSELAPLTTYTVHVIAVDGAGHTAKGPEVTFKTTDTTAPVWTQGAALTTSQVTPKTLTLNWPEAVDTGGIAGYQIWRDKVQVGTTDGATTFKVTGLTPGTSYTFTVLAMDTVGNLSDGGPTATVNTTDTSAPTWPQNTSLLTSKVTPNTLTLGWTPATDDVAVMAYQVHQEGVVVATVSGTTVDIQSLATWTDYTFEIRAIDGAGNVSVAGPVLTLKTPDNSPPEWPEAALLAVSELTPHSLTLSWALAMDDVSVVGYWVYQDDVLVAALGAGETTCFVTGLSPWTDVTFRVETADQAGNAGSQSLTVSVKTPDNMAPQWLGASLVASDVTPKSLTLTWSVATDDVAVTSYRVTLDGAELAMLAGDTQQLMVTDLSPWTNYAFTVEAVDPAGNWSTTGPVNSFKTTDTVSPTWPVDAALQVENLEATSLDLSWPNATDDVGVVEYVITLDGDDPMALDGALTGATVSDLTPTETYLLTVVAVDAAGNTSMALNTTVTPPDGGPPTWPAGQLTGSDVTGFSLTLNWTMAVDDTSVTAYRLYQDGKLVSEQETRDAVIDGLDHSTAYGFKVEAVDELGKWSTDGPSLTVSTTPMDDPGFNRLSHEQFNRTLADLMSVHFIEMYCTPGLVAWGCKNFGTPHGRSWYFHLMTGHYGVWGDYRRLYPHDLVEPAKGELRGGYRRFDQVVHPEHVNSWIYAAMMVAQSHFEDDTWAGSTGKPHEWGDMGWGDRIVFAPCEKAYKNNPGLFETEAQMYEDCVSGFITEFGLLAYRQPVTEEEHTHLLGVYQAVDNAYTPEEFTVHGPAAYLPDSPSPAFNRASRGLRNVIAVLLSGPRFVYRVELGDEDGNLTAYELASRLSYHFWNSMPDAELFAAAADGSLMTEEGYQVQVDRLAESAKAVPVITEFYEDYLRVEEIPSIQYQDSDFFDRRYALGVMDQKSLHPLGANAGYHGTRGIQEASRKELVNLGMWFTRTQPGTYAEMFQSNLNLYECGTGYTAQGNCSTGASLWSNYIYGVDAWDGQSEPIPLPEPERAGLLTRIGFLAHNSMTARPIRRGLKIQEMLLCKHIPPPESCDVVKPPVLTGLCEDLNGPTGVSCSDDIMCGENETCVGWDKEVTMTVRDKVEEITQTPGTTCTLCHSTFINGFGYALGQFSSEGRYWDKEHMFSVEKNGAGAFEYSMEAPENWPAANTKGTALVKAEVVTVDGAQDLADSLVATGQMESCWSREYFRFALGRAESDLDAESIESIAAILRNGSTLADGFKAIAFLPQFQQLTKPVKVLPPGDSP